MKMHYFGDLSRAYSYKIIVASVIDGDTLRLGISYCSKDDKFNKKLGKEIAISRLNDPFILNYLGERTYKEIDRSIVDYLLDVKNPDWVRNFMEIESFLR